MKAVVLTKTCRAEELHISHVEIPAVKSGWVLIKVKAFGLNRSELILRSVEADMPTIQLPRIPGIECAGEIVEASDSHYRAGQKVIALMGGMGRSFDGSYAEYVLAPTKQVFAVDCELSCPELAAFPETFFTAYGSLFDCLQLGPSDSLLIRAGSSALGVAAIQLGKSIGCTVLATTRDREKQDFLRRVGADYVLVEDGTVTQQVHALFKNGVSKILELIGPATLKESLGMLAYHGIVCDTGILGHETTLDGFDPIKEIPNGVYLSSFFSNYPTQEKINSMLEHIHRYQIRPVITQVFTLEEIANAHRLMESNEVRGKIVVRVCD